MPFNINTMGYYSELDIELQEERWNDYFWDNIPDDVEEEYWMMKEKEKEEKFIEHQQECFNYDELPF